MTSKNTTLNTFQPSSAGDLTDASPSRVFDAFDEITPFEHRITVNGDQEYLVGKTLPDERGVFRLYHPVGSGREPPYAGSIRAERFNDPEVVVVEPYNDEAEETNPDSCVIHVTDLEVGERADFGSLNACLNRVKTALTGKDWTVDGRADTSWDEWNDAIITLLKFYDDTYDDPEFTLTHEFMKGALMHAIARYPSDASKLLSCAEMRLDRIDDSEESSRDKISPFNVERVILDFAAANDLRGDVDE